MTQARPTDSLHSSRPEQREDIGEPAGHQDNATGTKPGEEWLIYNGTYQPLTCAFHGYAVCNLESHLRDRHPDTDHRARDDLVRRHKGLWLQGPTRRV
ncbi:hypothetical protein QSH57_004796 [Fusarium oxysporum f. sp. vasinfectum]|nr:hypothetical protein QSH57_004796 [Fusarium oxysporum f. sp. vasinfectum]